MKIAYLNSCYPAMSHTFIQREIEAVRANGIEVETFSCRKPDAAGTLGNTHSREAAQTTYLLDDHLALIADQPSAHPLRYARLLASARSTRQVAYVMQAARLAKQMRQRGITHVHVHMANNGADVARLATQLDPALSYSLMIHGPSDFFDVHALDLPRKVAQAKFVCCISHFCRSQIMTFTPPELWSKLHIVHCGIDPRKFSPAQTTTSDHPLRILTVGRLAPVKGQLQLLEACDRLNIDWQLNIVGDGPLRAQLEAAADPKRVTFSGAVSPEDMAAHYDAADLFVLSSFAEGVPVVLMEAMAKGLPVIATQVGGVSELIDDGATGRLIAPSNVDALVEAIAEAAANELPWVSADDARRAKVVDEFNITTIGSQLTSLFQKYSAKQQEALGAVALQV